MPISPGTAIGPYEIIDALGSGGMGEVYRARDTRLDRIVAFKIIGQTLGSPTAVRRFELEARATSAINHSNIVALYDVGEHEGAPYLVTESLQGETLRERIHRGPIPAAKAIEFARQIASGLAAAHDRGIVHRDLKPENIFITSDGNVKILDFGLAKVAAAMALDAPTVHVEFGMTGVGSIVGTASYMSPEQVRGENLDYRSDLFSFGAVFFEMLTASAAFRQATPVETMHAVLNKEPGEIPVVSPTTAQAAFIVRQCLEKNPRERFQSARDLELHLGAMVSGRISSGSAVVPALPVPPKRRLIAAVAIVLGLVAALGAGFVAGRRGASAPEPVFRQLTFRRGRVESARFTGDGHTVVYSAAWEGAPLELFSTRIENPDSRSIEIKSASLLSVSSAGEMAVAIERRTMFGFVSLGTLARMPLVGGLPREVMKEVVHADWSPDGSALAVARSKSGKFSLEYPIGKVLYESAGWIADVRVSRDGRSLAFVEHPVYGDDGGDICVLGPDGKKEVVSAGWASATGVAWSPRGNEIWFTASEAGPNASLWAAKPGGARRLLLRSRGRATLLDVTQAGDALISEGRLRLIMAYRDGLRGADQIESWLDATLASDISADGSTLVFDELGEGMRGHKYSVFLRKPDGSPAVRIGDGYQGSLSSDERSVAALIPGSPEGITILPTGAGEAVILERGPLVSYAAVTWLPGGREVLIAAREKDGPPKLYLQEVKGGPPHAVSPAGYSFPVFTSPASPDGGASVAVDPQGQLSVVRFIDGTVQRLKGYEAGDRMIRWSGDGRSVYVLRAQEMPGSIWKISLDSGAREQVISLAPTDPAGYLSLISAQITPGATHLSYSFGQHLSDLYLVQGLQ